MDELKDVRCFTSRDDNGDIKRTDIDKWGHSLKSDDKLLLVCKKCICFRKYNSMVI